MDTCVTANASIPTISYSKKPPKKYTFILKEPRYDSMLSPSVHRQNINKSCKNDMLPLGTKIQLIRRHTCPCKIAEAENCR